MFFSRRLSGVFIIVCSWADDLSCKSSRITQSFPATIHKAFKPSWDFSSSIFQWINIVEIQSQVSVSQWWKITMKTIKSSEKASKCTFYWETKTSVFQDVHQERGPSKPGHWELLQGLYINWSILLHSFNTSGVCFVLSVNFAVLVPKHYLMTTFLSLLYE